MSVCCANMIAATRSPYLGFHQTPPRVISEIKKPTPAWPRENVRPRISGELLCWMPTENRWRAKRVSVRCGQLQMGAGSDSARLALRRLSLTQGPHQLSFALRRAQDTQPVLILQASNQREFDLWVRTIAIELIRQTPLDAIKYLDILTLTPQLHSTPKTESIVKDCNHNCIPITNIPLIETQQYSTFRPRALHFDKLDENRNVSQTFKQSEDTIATITNTPSNIPRITREVLQSTETITPKVVSNKKKEPDDEQTVELLLRKCQNADSYVPVKEKLKLFESLCRLGQIVNNEELTPNNVKYGSKRTRSLHDLSNSEFPVPANAGVKQMCKYFETKKEDCKETDVSKYNTIARGNRTSCGPVKSMISRKYSVQTGKNY